MESQSKASSSTFPFYTKVPVFTHQQSYNGCIPPSFNRVAYCIFALARFIPSIDSPDRFGTHTAQMRSALIPRAASMMSHATLLDPCAISSNHGLHGSQSPTVSKLISGVDSNAPQSDICSLLKAYVDSGVQWVKYAWAAKLDVESHLDKTYLAATNGPKDASAEGYGVILRMRLRSFRDCCIDNRSLMRLREWNEFKVDSQRLDESRQDRGWRKQISEDPVAVESVPTGKSPALSHWQYEVAQMIHSEITNDLASGPRYATIPAVNAFSHCVAKGYFDAKGYGQQVVRREWIDSCEEYAAFMYADKVVRSLRPRSSSDAPGSQPGAI